MIQMILKSALKWRFVVCIMYPLNISRASKRTKQWRVVFRILTPAHRHFHFFIQSKPWWFPRISKMTAFRKGRHCSDFPRWAAVVQRCMPFGQMRRNLGCFPPDLDRLRLTNFIFLRWTGSIKCQMFQELISTFPSFRSISF